ncbi:FecR domain-containing protein [Parabacteroides sp. PF5-6]|uniref:FecR family protein n=1 Tax=Parabacteroides sp. PF5-6 TaxID=1742403 RepID=UPI0024049A2E|nr:FecR domain-containing protein [Parabacteroides sp. PF5-6]MDF9831391.1 transmembrane sensor [Parabacteroides sp. PF5-6]
MKSRLVTLYINYLLGSYSKEEFLEMKALIRNVDNRELEEMMHNAWSDEMPFPSMAEPTKTRLKSNILTAVSFADGKRRKKTNWWAVAAVALILLFSGQSLFYWVRSPEKEESPVIVNIDKGQKAVIKLPDNSDVHLNAETRLAYDLNNRKQRHVTLSGEAYFEVEKNEERPFIVDMGEVQIWVVGTSFNAKTYNDEEYIYASLVDGSIKLTSKYFEGFQYLSPKEQFVFSKKDGSFRIIPFDNLQELGWMEDRLTFSSEPLHKIITRIERWYGVNIDLQCPEIKDDLMSGAFLGEELIDVLEAVKIQYNVDYTVKGKNVVISINK